MKKFNLLVIAIITLLTFSCSKDEEPITVETILTTSKQDYKNAKDGDWVIVTKEEYNKLATDLNEVKKIGLNDDKYETDISKLRSATNYTLSNTGDSIPKITKDSYVFAFKYVIKDNKTGETKIKISSDSDASKGYSNLGSSLPTHTGNGEHFFVIKGNNIKNTADGHLAIYSPKTIGFLRGLNSKFIVRYRNNSDSNSLTSTSSDGIAMIYQGLSTTKKQW